MLTTTWVAQTESPSNLSLALVASKSHLQTCQLRSTPFVEHHTLYPMVQVSTMLLGLAAMALAVVQADQAPAFDVPSFDYTTLSVGKNPDLVLAALKKDGIISLKNIPSYASARDAYLLEAAACAVSAKEANAEFLLHKTFPDNTKRYTISTASGQDLDTTAMKTDALCPGYAKYYHEFTSILERAVSSLADTLDATTFTTQDGYAQAVSSRKLFGEAVRLDHFHAYEAAPAPSNDARRLKEQDTFALHEDDGMFIAFPAPAFYKVKSDNSLESVAVGSDADSGLVIETQDHQRVRPVLKTDEVTVMIGTGFNKWVATSDKLPAVTHGMKMPSIETSASERLLRAWFGKMTLLPSYQRMLTQMTFEQHANATTRFLKQGSSADMMTIGCAPGRKLVASATPECSFKDCTTKPGVAAPSEPCSLICNRSHGGDAENCAASCNCVASSHRATNCWMVCVKDLDTCATNDQVCSGQALTCKATPVPTTQAPTPPPTTNAPATQTPAPTTRAPSSTAPAPSTTAPAPSSTTSTPSSTTSTPSTTTSTPSTTLPTPSTTAPTTNQTPAPTTSDRSSC